MTQLAPRPVKRFRLHRTLVEIHGEEAASLLGDFDFFTDRPREPGVRDRHLLRFEVIARAPARADLPEGAATRAFAEGTLYRQGPQVFYEYGAAVLAVERKGHLTQGRLITAEPALVSEIGARFLRGELARFLAGENLHRVAALGLGLPNGDGALVLLPRGFDRGALTLALLETGRCVLLSAESPLVDPLGRIHPYPLPVPFASERSVGERWRPALSPRPEDARPALSASAFPSSFLPRPDDVFRPRFLVKAERHGGAHATELRSLPRWRGGTALLSELVVGATLSDVEAGFPDLASALGFVPRSASRFAAASTFLARAEGLRFRLGLDPAQNAEALLAHLAPENSLGPNAKER